VNHKEERIVKTKETNFCLQVFTLPLETPNLQKLHYLNLADTKKGDFTTRDSFDKQFVSPTFYKGKFRVEKRMDTFLKLSGKEEKGIVLSATD